MMQDPLITIITPSYNRASFIETAVKSVMGQDYAFVEHIVVDGNSTDGTPNILAKFPHLVTIIEPDRGLYDAINKGIRRSRGEIIGFLNSDDYYENETLKDVVNIFQQNPQVDVVIGQALLLEQVDSKSTHIEKYPPLRQETLLQQLVSDPPTINSWFFRRQLLDRVGEFDLDFPIGADRDFLIRLCSSGITPYIADRVFYNYVQHADSLTINSLPEAKERTLRENLRLARKYMNITAHGSAFWRQCQAWHDFRSIKLAALLLQQLRLLDLVDTVRLALHYNWKWFFVVMIQGLKYITRQI